MGSGASRASKLATAAADASDAATYALPSASHFDRAVAAALLRNDEACMRKVFNRHADSTGKLSFSALMTALKEVDAPVLASSSSDDSFCSAQRILHRAGADKGDAVEFSECAS
jgi:hypothetical protein